jgi:hypothetical protein
MTDNPHYRLSRRIDAARAKAEISIDPADHALANALQGVAGAQVYALKRAAYTEKHGTPDPDSFVMRWRPSEQWDHPPTSHTLIIAIRNAPKYDLYV